MKIKSFLAFLDISIIDIIPQKFQRELIESGLSKKKLFLQNVRMEELKNFHLCPVISKTINGKFNVDGFAFYSLLQFCYGKKFRFDLIEAAIKNDKKLFFFREDMFIKNKTDFNKIKNSIKIFKINNQTFIKKILSLQ